jgi:pyrimidine operon attenuation protein/uracil phosphoribosyltransferase
MSTLTLDAQALYAELLAGVRPLLKPDLSLVGVWSGGAWLAEKLQADLGLPGSHGVISSTLAVLVDRGGRELPIQPAFAAARVALPAAQRLSLARIEDGGLTFTLSQEH